MKGIVIVVELLVVRGELAVDNVIECCWFIVAT
jgi:hypothetical protein